MEVEGQHTGGGTLPELFTIAPSDRVVVEVAFLRALDWLWHRSSAD